MAARELDSWLFRLLCPLRRSEVARLVVEDLAWALSELWLR